MTTIAWDGEFLAADTLVTTCGLPRIMDKIWRLYNGDLFGGAGDTQDILLAKEWLNKSEEIEKPKLEESFRALLVTTEGLYILEDKLIKMPCTEPFWAIGSGRDFAIAAMHLGYCAKDAIQISARFDLTTGGKITVLELQK